MRNITKLALFSLTSLMSVAELQAVDAEQNGATDASEQTTDNVEQVAPAERTPSSDEILDAKPTAQTTAFNIWEYRVTGNTLLSNGAIESAVYAFLGPEKSIDDIEKARVALEQTYKAQGYPAVVVTIPEQTVKKGIVYLEVVEGKIERVKITGSKYHSLKAIRKRVPALTRGNVLYLPDVQAQLADLNQASQNRSVVPVLRPGRAPGTVEVELRVNDVFPFHGNIEVNNQHTADTTTTRAGVQIRYDNLFQKQHNLSLQYLTSPEDTDEVSVFAGTYILPITYPADRLVMYGIQTDSNVTTIGDLTVLGDGQIVGIRYIKSLLSLENYYHSFSIGADYKNFEDSQAGTTFPISYWSGNVRYDGSMVSKKSLFQYNLSAIFGLPINAKRREFLAKRSNSKTSFIYFTAGLSYKYNFDNGVEMHSRLDGQFATSPLVNNEQFSFGGANSVRGYYESQVLNDTGFYGSVELVSPHLFKSTQDVNDFRLFAFYDVGMSDRLKSLPGEDNRVDLSSTGIGLRAKVFNHWMAELDGAIALKENRTIKKDDVRWHAKLSYEF